MPSRPDFSPWERHGDQQRPIRVSFVCLGNICRSPMAESVLRYLVAETGLADQIVVDSFGTGGWHVGGGADPRTDEALRRRGYDTGHRARQISAADIERATWVVGLDQQNVADLRDLAGPDADVGHIRTLRAFDPAAPPGAEVPDPYYGDETDFEHALDLIEVACAGLLSELQATLTEG